MLKRLKTLIALIYVALVLVMGLATFVEQVNGTAFSLSHIYHSWWFFALWGLLAVSSVALLWHHLLWQRISVCLLHVALLLILAGAATTYITSSDGQMHLHTGSRLPQQALRQEHIQGAQCRASRLRMVGPPRRVEGRTDDPCEGQTVTKRIRSKVRVCISKPVI